MNAQELKDRIKSLAYRSINVCESLPKTLTSQTIAKQLLRLSLSAAANYRSATRSQSKKQFLSKLNIALEGLDESLFWLEALNDLKIIPINKLSLLLTESEELVKILSATKNTTKKNLTKETKKS
jgi:four helix bundle protein